LLFAVFEKVVELFGFLLKNRSETNANFEKHIILGTQDNIQIYSCHSQFEEVFTRYFTLACRASQFSYLDGLLDSPSWLED